VNAKPLALALVTIAAATGVAACGSSSKSSSSQTSSAAAAVTSSAAATSSASSTTAAASVAGGTLNGGGSTFAAPIYQQWSSTLKSQGLTVNYNPVGSGTGVTDLQTATVDFAGDDQELLPADKKGMKGPVLQFPVGFGAITVSYNLPGIKSGLKLTGPVIADMFMGKIKTWDDPAIKALNPGVSLPSTAITVVHRSDSSGTTAGFTTYLSDVSPAWKSSLGANKVVKWPVGTGGNGNSGVAAAVKQTSGAVGYVEQAYALVNGFTFAAVKNSAGKYILPTIANTSAAAQGVKLSPDLGMVAVNSPSPAAYPITSQTFLDVYTDPCKDGGANAGTAKALKSFLAYAFGAGQKTLGAASGQIPYAPLPAPIAAKDNAQLTKLTCNGSPVS
jgi:phosphate transport system substrate-binding protein